jgi:hypothetical protein
VAHALPGLLLQLCAGRRCEHLDQQHQRQPRQRQQALQEQVQLQGYSYCLQEHESAGQTQQLLGLQLHLLELLQALQLLPLLRGSLLHVLCLWCLPLLLSMLQQQCHHKQSRKAVPALLPAAPALPQSQPTSTCKRTSSS